MAKRNVDMLNGPLLPNIIRYTVPIILTSILQLLFNDSDLVIVCKFCGSISVGAVGATGAITNLLLNFFIGLSVGSGVLIAYGMGKGNDEDVQNTLHTAIPIAIVGGLILAFLGFFLSKPLLTLMDTPDTILPLSVTYMRIYFGGVIFVLLYNYCAAILRAVGDTKSPLIYLTLAGVVNVCLNVVFVTVFHMNVAGVALATIMSQALASALVIRALMRRTDACKLHLSKLRFHIPQFKEMLRIGLPAGIQGSLFSISNILIQSSVNSFGDIFMSGNAAAGNIEGFVYVALNAFSQTMVNFIGQNTGAGKYDRIGKITKICFASVIMVGLVFGGGVCIFGRPLLSIYITDSQEAIGYGMTRLLFVCLPYFLCGLMECTTGALRGLGKSFVPMVISVVGVCGLRVAWVLTVFRAIHTPECLFISYPVTWTVTFLVQLGAFIFVYKKILKDHNNEISA
ncbi:MAG: MATE family efflux transporter [Firmicutes bacterium]|nr:MATE family efflux transporter [Bacillota bacterium]